MVTKFQIFQTKNLKNKMNENIFIQIPAYNKKIVSEQIRKNISMLQGITEHKLVILFSKKHVG